MLRNSFASSSPTLDLSASIIESGFVYHLQFFCRLSRVSLGVYDTVNDVVCQNLTSKSLERCLKKCAHKCVGRRVNQWRYMAMLSRGIYLTLKGWICCLTTCSTSTQGLIRELFEQQAQGQPRLRLLQLSQS